MVKKHLLEKLKDLKCDIDKIEHKFIPKAKIEEFNRLLAEIRDVLGEKVDVLEVKVSDKAEMLEKIAEFAELLENEVI